MVNLVQHNTHFSRKKNIGWLGLTEGVILIQNGVEVTQELQNVGFNEQWLIGPA